MPPRTEYPQHELGLVTLKQFDDVVSLKPKQVRGCAETRRGYDPEICDIRSGSCRNRS